MEATESSVSDDALAFDAQSYATEWEISLKEAIRRLDLQGPAGELNAALEANESKTFGGLWLQHGPEFRVIASFTHSGEETIEPYIEGRPLDDVVETRTADATLEFLKITQSKTMSLVIDDLGIRAESAIIESDNHVELYILDPGELENALRDSGKQLPDKVKAIGVD